MSSPTPRIVAGLLVALGACGRGDVARGPDVRNLQEPSMTTTELSVTARWSGPIYLARDEEAPAALAIRDAAGYDALLARLPAERIQMKQPAPPSTDPLRARPPIDFATQMLVVVTRADTLSPPTIARVIGEPGRIVVRFSAPSPGPEARPSGVGGYAAVQVPRAEGALDLVGPRVIDAEAGLAAAVGDLVTLRGPLARTRIPTLLGVDVDEGSADGDAPAEATGWLEQTVVTQAEIDARIAKSGQYANRGPGRFYRLVAPLGAGLAPAQRVW